ncbi:putative ABC exporter domain-containing protein [Halovulum sp. GXIMD14794]
MDVALLRLLAMRMRGGLRLRMMQIMSLRGALFFLALGGIIWLLIATGEPVPNVRLFGGAGLDSQAMRDQISTFMPLGLLGMTLLTVALTTGPSFHFSPTEINFLFVGPFSRRDLILYKFIAYTAGAALSAALIAPFAQAQTGSALSAFTATLLTLLFVQLNSAAAGMAWQAFEGNRLARIKWPATATVFAIAVAAMIHAWAVPDRNVFDLLSEVRHSWIGTVLLMPYIVFTELFLARTYVSHMAFWATLAVLINVALLWTVVMLDGRTSERSLGEYARKSDRWERIKQGGSFWAIDRTEVHSIRTAPMLGGLGPIAWRQAIKADRNSSKVITVFLGVAACAGPVSSATGIPITDDRALMMVFFFFGFILPRTLICDFRGDLSRMETYKTLPIAPWRICAGQLAVQVLLSFVVALTLIVSLLLFEHRVTAPVALALAVFALPLTLLIYAVENTIFLLFPAKLIPMGRADFEFLGRSLLEFIAKMLIVLFALMVAGGLGAFAFITLKTTLVLAGVVSWLALILIGGLATLAMQYAFRRFVVAEAFD